MFSRYAPVIILCLAIVLPSHSLSQKQQTGKIIVDVTDIQGETGDVKYSLHNQPDAFPGKPEAAVATARSDITGSTSRAVFDSVPYGEYAVSIIHDENLNGILETKWMGMPTEGFGASNDAPAVMGPPRYKDARFNLDTAELRLTIKMVYF